MLPEVERNVAAIDAVLEQSRQAALDEFFLSMVYQHVCVRISGSIEQSIKLILSEYTRRRANASLQRAINQHLKSFQNPKFQKIVNLLGDFNEEWSRGFELEAANHEWRDRIDSIAANRNLIAHGRPSGVSAARVGEFQRVHRASLEWLDQAVLGA